MIWILCKQKGGVLEDASGQVLSLEPSSNTAPFGPYTFARRPAGTDGAYEQMTVSGGFAVYNPKASDPVVFGFVLTVPNAPGFSAISATPLP